MNASVGDSRSVSTELPDWVRCPQCRGALEAVKSLEAVDGIACTKCKTRYGVKDGIPVLLEESVRVAAEAHTKEEDTEGYHAARHVSPANMEYYDYWCSDLLRRIPPAPAGRPRRVIELMCGGAELSRRATELPRPIVAIDINRDLLALSRKDLVPSIIPVCSSAEQLPFEDGAIDLVLIQGGLHHVRKRVASVVREIGRVMAPGATLVASEPRNDHPANRAFRRLFYNLHPIPEEEEEDGFTRRELQELFEGGGLRLEQYDPFAYLGYMLIGNTDLVPLFARMPRNRLSSALIGLDRLSAKLPVLRGLGWASEIVGRKPD